MIEWGDLPVGLLGRQRLGRTRLACDVAAEDEVVREGGNETAKLKSRCSADCMRRRIT